MNMLVSNFRQTKSAQRRWDDYPAINEMVLQAYHLMQMSAKQEMTLNPALLQDLNHAVLSFASRNYPIRIVSSILNKLRADHKEFIVHLENELSVERGYDFFEARLDIDFLANMDNYKSSINSLTPDQIGQLVLMVDSADLHKDNRSYFHFLLREVIFGKEDTVSISQFFSHGAKNYPHIFSGVSKHEVEQRPLFREVIVDFLFDDSFDLNKDLSLFFHMCLDYMSKTYAGFIIDKINTNFSLSNTDRPALLINIIENKLGSTFDDAIEYLADEILNDPGTLKNKSSWAFRIASDYLLSKNEDWTSYSIGEAAIIFNGSDDVEYSINAFINALERESVLNEAESLAIIDLNSNTKKEVSKLYYPAFKFILENAKQKSVRSYSIITQNRIFEYAYATNTEDTCKQAFYQAYEDVLSGISVDAFKAMTQEYFIAARDKFGLSIEPLSSSNKRMLLDTELAM